MYSRLLDFLCCPTCGGNFVFDPLAQAQDGKGDGARDADISEGLLHCPADHWFPVVRGIPRMLPDSLDEHWELLEPLVPATSPVRAIRSARSGDRPYDRRTRENFSLEWEHHELGDKTWGMDLETRVRGFFIEPMRLPPSELEGKVLLDAGCGNGSQSVAYTEHGLEIIAADLSSGLERGQAFRHMRPGARPERVHFVQADLQAPPFRPGCVDMIHSAGVLHHTPDTERTFRRLCQVLRPDGQFYVWVYKYEAIVTPVVNTLRRGTTRLSSDAFARVAWVAADLFRLFTSALNALRIRSYVPMTRREAALALMDIFGAPHAHYHTVDEVSGWFRSEGFGEIWDCNHSRRGFGVCGRRAPAGGQRKPAATASSAAVAPPA